VVPDKTFKVAVVLDAAGEGSASVTTRTRVIAVMMPNSDLLISETAPWRNFRVSVDAIEAATGDGFPVRYRSGGAGRDRSARRQPVSELHGGSCFTSHRTNCVHLLGYALR